MKVSYFPGCTLKNKAKKLDEYGYKCATALGFELEEISAWQCCGGTFTTSSDEIATKLSSVRALKEAESKNQPLVTLCSACHNVIKQTNHAIQTNETFRSRVNNYMADGEYVGGAKVMHYLEVLRDVIGYDAIKEKVVNSLAGKKVACYYGCLLLRPSKVMQMDDAENPQIIENLVRALGGEPVLFPYKNECCGAYVSFENKDYTVSKSSKVCDNAVKNGADIILTACPLCKYNLERCGSNIPVVYFTELLAEALGVKE